MGAIVMIPILLKLAFFALAVRGGIAIVQTIKRKKGLSHDSSDVTLNPARVYQQANAGKLSISIN